MLIRKDTLRPWEGEVLGELRHPLNIEQVWTVEELAAIGLVKAVHAVLPQGMMRLPGPATYDINGVETIPFGPFPEPTPEEIEENIQRRLAHLDIDPMWGFIFDLWNEVRVLKGLSSLTKLQFKAVVRNRL